MLEPASPSLGDSGQQSSPLISPVFLLNERERFHVGRSSASALSASASMAFHRMDGSLVR